MEIERPRNENKSTVTRQLPTAPDLDQESLSNYLDDDSQIPERIERAQPISMWNRMKNLFSRTIKEDEANLVQNTIVNSNLNQNNLNNVTDPVFNDLVTRNNFLRKLYAYLSCQMSLFTALAALFYYIPHLRKIFRTTFADKILYRSIFGPPFGILIFLLLFESVRRRFANLFLIGLTACLSCLLCYAMSFQADNLLLLMELASIDGSFIFAGLLNFIMPKFTLRNRFETLFFPMFMIVCQGLQPFLIKKHLSQTWFKNLFFVGSTSYLGYNIGSVLNNDRLALKPNEVPFGLLQSYINFNPIESTIKLFRNRSRGQNNLQII